MFASDDDDAAGRELNVLIRLSAKQGDPAQLARPALDLAIVLDRSGSMSGDKLRFAKQAALDLLARLEPRDRVTLIAYDQDVELLATGLEADSAGVEQLRAQLLAIEPGGSTALGPALFEALDRLRDAPPRPEHLRHVLLLSDGVANSGESSPKVIAARVAGGFGAGISVSTLGMGLDYNEDLMTTIADEGGGRYHFIADAQLIPAALGDEFAGLTATVAAELTVAFAASGQTKLAEVHGYVSTTEAERTNIRVGTLGAGQSREIVARLQLAPEQLEGSAGDVIELGMITVRYRPAHGDAGPVEFAFPAQIRGAGSQDQARRSEHSEVTVRVAEVEVGAVMREAALAVDRGDFDDAKRMLGGVVHSKELDTKLEAATDDTQRRRIQQLLDEAELAQRGLDKARTSIKERKNYIKLNKAEARGKSKGEFVGHGPL